MIIGYEQKNEEEVNLNSCDNLEDLKHILLDYI